MKQCAMCSAEIGNRDNYCTVHAAEVLLLLENTKEDD